VVPISSTVTRIYPCESPLDWNGAPCKAMADQISTVSKQRLKSKLATLSIDDIRGVERAICLQLGLSPPQGKVPSRQPLARPTYPRAGSTNVTKSIGIRR